MSGAFESTLLSPPRSTNKLFMETGFGVNAGFERSRNTEVAVSDGATTNRVPGGIYGPFDAVNNPREYVAGAASLTIAAVMAVPTSNPSADAFICAYMVNATGPQFSFNNQSVFIDSAGALKISIHDGSGNYRIFSASTFRAAYSGLTVFLKVYFVQGTTNPVVSCGGTDISVIFSASTIGTPLVWLSASLTPTYRTVGLNWPSGPAPLVTPILGTTTAADDAFYMQTGKWPAWVVAGASNVAYKSNTFNSESAGWVLVNSATITNNVGFVTFGGLSSNSGTARVQALSSLNANAPVIVSFEYRKTGGSGNIAFSLGNFPSGDAGNDGLNNWSETADTSGSFVSRSLILRNTTGSNSVLFFGGAVTYDVRNFSMKNQGALSIPSVQQINVMDDVSGIGSNCGLILGGVTTATSNKKVWRIADLTKTSGNEQLLGGSVFVGTSQDFIKSWTIVNAGGTTTVSLGNASGGAQYVSGLSVPTGTTVVTLLTNTPLTTNLWCNANTTASLTHTIEGYRTV